MLCVANEQGRTPSTEPLITDVLVPFCRIEVTVAFYRGMIAPWVEWIFLTFYGLENIAKSMQAGCFGLLDMDRY